MPTLDMDFGATSVSQPPAAQPVSLHEPDLVIDASPSPSSAAPIAATPATAPAVDAGMIEFDLGALSLDLDSPADKAAAPAAAPAPTIAVPQFDHLSASKEGPVSSGGFQHSGSDGSDPLATKLALAQEFNAIGDPDGARSLAKEVLAEASGDLKSRAQRFLADIS
jgi:pilus assembly protein FimV